jgi:hypothetical protein
VSAAEDIAEATAEFAADIAGIDCDDVPAIVVIVRVQDGPNEADLAMVENFASPEELAPVARRCARASAGCDAKGRAVKEPDFVAVSNAAFDKLENPKGFGPRSLFAAGFRAGLMFCRDSLQGPAQRATEQMPPEAHDEFYTFEHRHMAAFVAFVKRWPNFRIHAAMGLLGGAIAYVDMMGGDADEFFRKLREQSPKPVPLVPPKGS